MYYKLGSVYRQQGKYEEAITALKKSLELTGGFSWVEGELGYVYGLSGEREKARQMLNKRLHRKKEKYVTSSSISRRVSTMSPRG